MVRTIFVSIKIQKNPMQYSCCYGSLGTPTYSRPGIGVEIGFVYFFACPKKQPVPSGVEGNQKKPRPDTAIPSIAVTTGPALEEQALSLHT
jgi:hypothetical protein